MREVQATRDESWNASAVIGQTPTDRGPWQQCKSTPRTATLDQILICALTNFRTREPTLFSLGGCQLFFGAKSANPVSNLSLWKRLPHGHAPRPIAFQIIKLIFPSLHCRLFHKAAPAAGQFFPVSRPTWRRSSNPLSHTATSALTTAAGQAKRNRDCAGDQ